MDLQEDVDVAAGFPQWLGDQFGLQCSHTGLVAVLEAMDAGIAQHLAIRKTIDFNVFHPL